MLDVIYSPVMDVNCGVVIPSADLDYKACLDYTENLTIIWQIFYVYVMDNTTACF